MRAARTRDQAAYDRLAMELVCEDHFCRKAPCSQLRDTATEPVGAPLPAVFTTACGHRANQKAPDGRCWDCEPRQGVI